MRRNKIVVIHQPDFIPWIGFFDRLIKSDIFVVLDNVQYIRRGWHHRDKIKTVSGSTWLTVPVKKKGRYEQLINEVEIDYSQNWIRKHLNTLHHNYGQAKYFSSIFPKIEAVYSKNHQLLIDFNIALIKLINDFFNIQVEMVLSSSLVCTGSRTDLLINIVKKAGGESYLSGIGSKSYLLEDRFVDEKIDLLWQDFKHPIYTQLQGDFIPELSVLDFLFNCGTELKEYL